MDAISSALSGMQSASRRLDLAANDVANVSTPGFRPALGDLVEDMVAVARAPLDLAANARVVRAADERTATVIDVLA